MVTSTSWLVILAVVVAFLTGGTCSCPQMCTCINYTVLCVDPAINQFPAGVAEDTVTLTIKGNYSQRSQFHSLGNNELQSLTALNSLVISHTLLDSVNEHALQGLTKLLSLDLSFNRLTSLPQAVFNGLTSLSILILTGNPHLALPTNIFSGTRNLLQLHVGELGLARIDVHLFDGLDQLRYLDLSNNELTSLPVDVASDGFLRSLIELDVSFNRLTYIGNDSVPFFKRVRSIILAENPWQCNCELGWLQRIEFRNHIYPSHHGSEGLVCQGPREVAFMHLALLAPGQLVCVAPHIDHCDEVEPQDIGATFRIRCLVSGEPFPWISWKTPDGVTTIGSSQGAVGPQLDLDPPLVNVTLIASEALNGTVTLTAQNVYGVFTEKVNIVVKVPPTTTPSPTASNPTSSQTSPTPVGITMDAVTKIPTFGPSTIASSVTTVKDERGSAQQPSGGGDSNVMVYVAAGCSGLALIMSAITIGVVCCKMSKGGEQVKPCIDEEEGANGPKSKGRNAYTGRTKKDGYGYDYDDEGYGGPHDDGDLHYGGALSPGRLRLNDMPPRQPSPIAWDTNM